MPAAERAERDHPTRYAAPHPAVLRALQDAPDGPRLWDALPDALSYAL